MSTRSSGFYKNGLHLFFEMDHEQVCLDWPADATVIQQNEKYGSFTMSLEDWEEFAVSIQKKVDEARDCIEMWREKV